MLHINVSSGISSFVIFLLFLLEELSPGLTSLACPLGDPSDGKVELEIFLLSVESLLSSISSMDWTSYLLWPSAHPDWCLEPRLFLTSQPGFHSLNGLGPITALALVFLFVFSAFSLIPGGCAFFFLGTVSLMAAFAPMGAVFLVTAAEEFTFAALQLQLLVLFGKVFSTAV